MGSPVTASDGATQKEGISMDLTTLHELHSFIMHLFFFSVSEPLRMLSAPPHPTPSRQRRHSNGIGRTDGRSCQSSHPDWSVLSINPPGADIVPMPEVMTREPYQYPVRYTTALRPAASSDKQPSEHVYERLRRRLGGAAMGER
jgi:hypothetical protein